MKQLKIIFLSFLFFVNPASADWISYDDGTEYGGIDRPFQGVHFTLTTGSPPSILTKVKFFYNNTMRVYPGLHVMQTDLTTTLDSRVDFTVHTVGWNEVTFETGIPSDFYVILERIQIVGNPAYDAQTNVGRSFYGDSVAGLDYSTDGNLMIRAFVPSPEACCWNLYKILESPEGEVKDVCFDSYYLYVISDYYCNIWRSGDASFNYVTQIRHSEDRREGYAVWSDDTYILTGQRYGYIELYNRNDFSWQTEKQYGIWQFEDFYADSYYWYGSDGGEDAVYVWDDIANWSVLTILEVNWPRGITADSYYLYVAAGFGFEDRGVHIWELGSFNKLTELPLESHGLDVTVSDEYVYATEWEFVLHRWDKVSWNNHTFYPESIGHGRYSIDSSSDWLLMAGYPTVFPDASWSVETKFSWELASRVAIERDSDFMVSASNDDVRIWGVADAPVPTPTP